MLNRNVGRNLLGCTTKWTMGVKNKKIRESFQETQNPANRFYRKRV